ncbi:hypothetical protein EON66_08280, partial [archaeon]
MALRRATSELFPAAGDGACPLGSRTEGHVACALPILLKLSAPKLCSRSRAPGGSDGGGGGGDDAARGVPPPGRVRLDVQLVPPPLTRLSERLAYRLGVLGWLPCGGDGRPAPEMKADECAVTGTVTGTSTGRGAATVSGVGGSTEPAVVAGASCTALSPARSWLRRRGDWVLGPATAPPPVSTSGTPRRVGAASGERA